MRNKALFAGMVVIAISVLIAGIEITASSDDLFGKHEISSEQSEKGRFVVLGETNRGIFGVTVSSVTPCSDELLRKYEKSDVQFAKYMFEDMIVYEHLREIDGAIVEPLWRGFSTNGTFFRFHTGAYKTMSRTFIGVSPIFFVHIFSITL